MSQERAILFLAFFIIGFAVVLIFDKPELVEDIVINCLSWAVSEIWDKSNRQ